MIRAVATRSKREFPALTRSGSMPRFATRARPITYSRKVFIPLTNLCRDRCGYCTFAREPGDAKAHTITPDEVLAISDAGKKGRMQGRAV